MSTDLADRPELGYLLSRFSGGDALGPCAQITGVDGHVQLTRTGARTLIHDLLYRFLRSIPTVGDANAALADEAGVEDLAMAMKEKLAKKREEGHDGWYDLEKCPSERLALLLLNHVAKGDPVDIANFAMFLHNRKDAQGALSEVFPVWLSKQQNELLEAARAETATARLERNKERERAAELEAQAARLEGERNEARRLLEKESERMRKELEHSAARLRQSEQNLARALGYIDRVTEDQPPPPGIRQERREAIGDISTTYVSGPDPRGPRLELGEPVPEDPFAYRDRFR